MKRINASTVSFEEWVRIGIENNYSGPPVCYTHDALPMSDAEGRQWLENPDICLLVMRVYDDDIQARQVQEGHEPTRYWMDTYLG
jgi:hypothetical protein